MTIKSDNTVTSRALLGTPNICPLRYPLWDLEVSMSTATIVSSLHHRLTGTDHLLLDLLEEFFAAMKLPSSVKTRATCYDI